METATTFTLDPTADPAALTALYVYAILSGDDRLHSDLRFLCPPNTLPKDHYDTFRWATWNEDPPAWLQADYVPQLVVTQHVNKEEENA